MALKGPKPSHTMYVILLHASCLFFFSSVKIRIWRFVVQLQFIFSFVLFDFGFDTELLFRTMHLKNLC